MAKQTFYFYDLETTSAKASSGRVMQFAGQRTDDFLQPIGKPDNILVKLSDDILPEPDAVLVHGVTPQATLESGIVEAEFARYFCAELATPGTVFVGYNNIRFDDEFMRRVCYRNFYDPYEWHWKDGRSRWDLLDPIRMMRALRPDGLKWPILDNKPTVKLELLAKENGFDHEQAHDALSDVLALIQLAQAFRRAQPKLFAYLLGCRDKRMVASVVLSGRPFVYTSGKYNNDYEKTTLAYAICKHPRRDGAVVYDLREDPEAWFGKTADELVKHWQARNGPDVAKLPIKTIQFNKCPAVAPDTVLDVAAQKRIKLDVDAAMSHYEKLKSNQSFAATIEKALDIMENKQQATLDLGQTVDYQMYDGFFTDKDHTQMAVVRAAEPTELTALLPTIQNTRLRELLPLYKARNFPTALTQDERVVWDAHRSKVLLGGGKDSIAARFYTRMQELAATQLTSDQEYLLTELQLYAESILPYNEETFDRQ